jgi:hypothetical protein
MNAYSLLSSQERARLRQALADAPALQNEEPLQLRDAVEAAEIKETL